MTKLMGDLGSVYFCTGKWNNSKEESHGRFRFHAFLHGGKESTAMKKKLEASGCIHFCIGEGKQLA